MIDNDKILFKLSCKLQFFRELRCYTQSQVAERVGISEVSISRYENMRSVPDAITLYKLAECYGVSVADFFKK